MKKYIIIFICIIIYKLLSNIICFIKIKSFYKKYCSFLSGKNNNISTYKRNIINLFKKAGIKDAYIPTAQPMGYFQIATFKSSIFTNFPNLLESHVSGTIGMFNEAVGVYRSRIYETFSPIYWINCIIFLPQNLFRYLGIDSEKLFIKILQIIWWILAPISIMLRNNLLTFIKHILSFAH